MKSIDISGPNGVAARAVATAATPVRAADAARPVRADTAETEASALSLASAGTSPPVDSERVAQIRKAIEEDRYPVVPARIADAMIAAGLLLRIK